MYIYMFYTTYIYYIYNVSLTSPVPSSGFPRPQLVAGLMLGPVLPATRKRSAPLAAHCFLMGH